MIVFFKKLLRIIDHFIEYFHCFSFFIFSRNHHFKKKLKKFLTQFYKTKFKHSKMTKRKKVNQRKKNDEYLKIFM